MRLDIIYTLIAFTLIIIVVALGIWGIVSVVQRDNNKAIETNNASARFVVGEDNVTAIELVYAQTHQMVDELILYKDDTGLARSGNQHIYINKSSCKIIVYRGE